MSYKIPIISCNRLSLKHKIFSFRTDPQSDRHKKTNTQTDREIDQEAGQVRMLNFTMIYILVKESNDEVTLNIRYLRKTLIVEENILGGQLLSS